MEADAAMFEPVCVQLEVALGAQAYQEALEEGMRLKLDDVMAEVAAMIGHPSEEHLLKV